jgi:hypothetical protein
MTGLAPGQGCFRAHGLAFGVITDVPGLPSHLERAFAPFGDDGEPDRLYSLLQRVEGNRTQYELHLDDQRLTSLPTPSDAIRELVRSVNREMMLASPGSLFLHSSAVEHAGVAVLLPGTQDAGKTTLAAGLTQSGLRYLTDEVVVLDPTSLVVRPFAKPLSVDPGSWEVLADLRPDGDESFSSVQWQVPAHAFGDHAVGPASRPALVVFPRYEMGAVTALAPVTPAEALMELARHCLNLLDHGARGLAALAEVVVLCPSYRLTMGDLGEACTLIRGLLQTEPRTRVAGRA